MSEDEHRKNISLQRVSMSEMSIERTISLQNMSEHVRT